MSFAVKPTARFLRELKLLKKRYASILDDVEALGEELTEEPRTGTPLGRHCYKVRLAIRSKGKGKSGGARVITCVIAVHEAVYLLSIYDKSDMDSISGERLGLLLAQAGLA